LAKLGRLITAMVTPFDASGELDLTGASRLARHLASTGSDGLVVAGTTGESPTLDEREKLQLCAAVSGAVGDGVTVILGVGTNATGPSAGLARRAADSGAAGLMVVTPYYNKPTQEGLFRHFATVSRASELPVMLYNVPGRTGVNLLPETVARLADEIGNLVAVKEAAGNLEQASELCRLGHGRWDVYSGDDALTLPMLAVGAAGVVSVASHLVGSRIQQLISAYLAGDVGTAQAIHWELFPLFRTLFITTNPIPVKTALELLGFGTAHFRLPLCVLDAHHRRQLQEAMALTGVLRR
jgi:4-hydroxy-tetrahydrodipicolinate synthase